MGIGKPDPTQPGMWTWNPSASSRSLGDIRQPEFATVRRGYDPTQVLEYLSGVADHVEALESKVRQLESDLGEARRQVAAGANQGLASGDPYESVSARVADLVKTFDLDVEKLRGDAKVEVDRMLSEARTAAERLILDAQNKAKEVRAQAERALQDARNEANKVLAGLSSRKEALLGELRTIREVMLNSAKDLEPTLDGKSAEDQVAVVGEAREGRPANSTPRPSSKGQPRPVA